MADHTYLLQSIKMKQVRIFLEIAKTHSIQHWQNVAIVGIRSRDFSVPCYEDIVIACVEKSVDNTHDALRREEQMESRKQCHVIKVMGEHPTVKREYSEKYSCRF